MQNYKQNTTTFGINQLFPIIGFLKRSWRTIIAGGLLGLLSGAGYLAFQPPVYQATVMISMAQVPSHRDYSAFSNIEEPLFLVERLKIPSTYTTQVINACKGSDEEMPPESMVQMISGGVPRAIASVAFIRIRRESPEMSERCANALFNMIRIQQDSFVRPVEEDLKRTLNSLRKRQEGLTNELNFAEKQGRYETLFFAKRDELIGLSQRIFDLNRGVEKITPTSLVAPIYVSPNPIMPIRILVMTAMTLAGVFLGLMVASFRELLRRHADSIRMIV